MPTLITRFPLQTRVPGKSRSRHRHRMSKQRRSLRITPPALMANYFIPPVEAESPFLLDDDPFANLSGVPAQTPSTPKPTTQKSTQPRSPLSPVLSDRVPLSTPSSPPAAVQRHSRAWSKSISSRAPVPAHQKPAFAPKPSLPSLDALSRMNVVLPKKARNTISSRITHVLKVATGSQRSRRSRSSI